MFGLLRLGGLPFSFALAVCINMVVVYVWAALREDVDPLFPYISSTADKRPESSFFGLMSNICSALLFSIVYVRYRQTAALHTNDTFIFPAKLNYYSTYFGFLGAAGMFLIANVQETVWVEFHLFCAVVTFGSGTIYMGMQTYVTYCMTPVICNYTMLSLRALFTLISAVLFILAIVFGTIAANMFHSVYPDLPTPRPWSRKIYQPGFGFHCASAACEWVMAFFHVLFILSFGPEFEFVDIEFNVQQINEESERRKLIEHRAVDPYGW